jgi:hypothetical protein
VRNKEVPTALLVADLDIITPPSAPQPGAAGGVAAVARERMLAEGDAIKALVQVSDQGSSCICCILG